MTMTQERDLLEQEETNEDQGQETTVEIDEGEETQGPEADHMTAEPRDAEMTQEINTETTNVIDQSQVIGSHHRHQKDAMAKANHPEARKARMIGEAEAPEVEACGCWNNPTEMIPKRRDQQSLKAKAKANLLLAQENGHRGWQHGQTTQTVMMM